MSKALSFWVIGAALLVLSGCGSSLAQPFDKMKDAPVTAFRLQNFEPPAAPAAMPGAPAAGPFQLPPQIQQWVQAGAALLPPGLLPPGLMPGAPGAATAPAPVANVPRFHDFRIIAYNNVTDAKVHDEVLDILGTEKNFDTPRESCMFPEFAFSIGQINQPPADVLVSLSCNQVRTFGFVWPHGSKTGLTPDASKRIVEVIKKTFAGG